MKVKLPEKKTSINEMKSEEEKNDLRRYWRHIAKKNRGKMYASPQAHRRHKEKERKRIKDSRQKKKTTDMINKTIEPVTPSEEENTPMTNQSIYNAACTARKCLPNTPKKFATIVSHIIGTATPRKRKALSQSIGILQGPEKKKRKPQYVEAEFCKEYLYQLRVDRSSLKKARQVLSNDLIKRSSIRLVSRITGWHRKTISRASERPIRLPRRDKITNKTKKLVKAIYKREDISRLMPNKRYATKKHGA